MSVNHCPTPLSEQLTPPLPSPDVKGVTDWSMMAQFAPDRGRVNIICDSSQPVSVPRRTFTVCYNVGHLSVTCVYNPGQSGLLDLCEIACSVVLSCAFD